MVHTAKNERRCRFFSLSATQLEFLNEQVGNQRPAARELLVGDGK